MIKSTLMIAALSAGVLACNNASTPATGSSSTGSSSTVQTNLEQADGLNAEAAKSSKWVMGYYVGYLANVQPLSGIDWRGITHIAVGIILPNADGSLDLNNTGILPNAAGRKAIVRTAHAKGRKAVAMIGGEGTGPQWTSAASDSNRANFITNLKKLVVLEGFDGIDLDWEPLETSDHPALLKLVQELRAQLPKAILTFPAGYENVNFLEDRTIFAKLAPYLNQINLMTYGMSGDYGGWKTWHSSAMYQTDSSTPTSVDATVNNYLKAGVPAAKLGIGIGFYGQCYGAPAKGPLEPTVGIQADGAKLLAGDNDLSYANILTQYATAGSRKWDASARVPYLSFTQPTGPKGCTYISYDDAQSIQEKANYVKAKGLGGAIIWNINEGYIANQSPSNPLLVTTRRAFGVR
jgi:chitinase